MVKKILILSSLVLSLTTSPIVLSVDKGSGIGFGGRGSIGERDTMSSEMKRDLRHEKKPGISGSFEYDAYSERAKVHHPMKTNPLLRDKR